MPDVPNEISAIHKKYAPSTEVFELVLTHCRIVRDICLQLIDKSGFKIDRQLVEKGALLHDIGVYRVLGPDSSLIQGAHYITHGIEGEKILKAENYPEKIWRFTSHHTGVGLTKNDITSQNLPLPIADYLAESDEELLVMYADKFHSKTLPSFLNSYEWYKNLVSQFGKDKVILFEEMSDRFGLPDLETISKTYHISIR